jgi:TP901 family phage tail tape measure protein
MAEISKTVEIIFAAKDQSGNTYDFVGRQIDGIKKKADETENAFQKFASGIDSFGGGINRFGQGVQNLTQPLSNLATKIELASAGVAALGVAFGGYALESFKKFEDASIDLDKVLDENDGALKDYQNTAKDLALGYGQSASVVLQGISDFKQAGFSATEAAQLQKDALDLVIAGGVGAGQASDILVKSLKGFGESASEASRYVEALNTVSNKYATDVTQLAEGISRISPIAKTMGFSFEEATGLLTPIIEVFGSGSEAADALKTGLLKLIDDSKPVREALKSIGVSQTDLNGNLRSGKDIFYDVAAAFKNLDENQKLFVTSQLVGIEQSPKMVKVFDDLGKVQAVTNTAMEHGNTVSVEREKRLNSLSVAAARNAEAWDQLSVSVGEKLSSGAVNSQNSLNALAQALTTAVSKGNFDPILNSIKAAELGFAQFIDKIAKNLPEALSKVDFSGLVASFGKLGGQFGEIFSGFDVSTPQGLAKAIQAIVDSLESLTLVSAGVVNGLTPLGKTFLASIQAFNSAPDSVKEFSGTVIGAGQAINALAGFVSGAGGSIEGLGESLKVIGGLKVAGGILDLAKSLGGVTGPLSTVTSLLGKAGIVGAVGGAGFALGSLINDGIDKLTSSLTGSQTTLGGWIYDITHTSDAVDDASKSIGKLDEDLVKINQSTGLNIKSQSELDKAINNGLIVYDELSQKWVSTNKAAKDFGETTDNVADSQKAWYAAVGQTNDMLGLNRDYIGRVVEQFDTLEEAHQAVLRSNSDVVQQNITYENGVYNLWQKEKDLTVAHKDTAEAAKKLEEETGKLTERQKIAIEHTNELEIKLLELASNERIKSMEFAVSLKVAEMETDAQRVVAAFEEIGQAVAATQAASAEIFASLTGALGDDKIRGLDKNFLREYALEQQKQAQQALDDQSRLIDAQIYWMNAKTEALNSGKPMITVNADDLAPELQLVLKSLLEHVQLEANAEGLELLLG